MQAISLSEPADNQVQVAVTIQVAHSHISQGDCGCVHRQTHHSIKGICRSIVQEQQHGLVAKPVDQVQVAVAIHIAQVNCERSAIDGTHIDTSHPVEGIGGAVVQVHPIGLVFVRNDQVQVTIAIQVAQRRIRRLIDISTQVHAVDAIERVARAIVQVEPVQAIAIRRDQIQVAVTVHITHRHAA